MEWLDGLVDFAARQVDETVSESLNARGASDEQIKHFQIGYLKKELPKFEYPTAFLKWCYNGAKLDGVYVFPLTNALGEIRGIQIRSVQREVRTYTDYIVDAGEAVLFGFQQAMPHIWRSETIMLVEGSFDLFPIQRHVPVVVATLTARVTDPLLKMLRRLCKRVVLGYDNDTRGRVACGTFLKEHGREFQVDNLKYPKLAMADGKSAKDPGDLWEVWGDQRLGEYVRNHVKITERSHGW